MRILNVIRRYEPIGRSDVAERTALSPSTVSKIVRELLDEGLILETETARTGFVGRHPIGLTLNAEIHTAFGIQVSDSRLTALLLDLRGNVIGSATEEVEEGMSVEQLIGRVSRVVTELAHPDRSVLGVGLAVAGMIDRFAGTVFAPNLFPTPLKLYEAMIRSLDMPVKIENEANTMLLAEQVHGIALNKSDVLGINIGLGIGAGLIMGGRLALGWSGSAGEIGHTVVDVNGPQCSCGNRGCLETLAGGKVLTTRLRALGDAPGVDISQKTLESAARYLGIGVANAVNTLNPDLVLIGGSHSSLFDPVIHIFRGTLESHLLPVNRRLTLSRVTVSNAEALGAGMLILNDFFDFDANADPNS